MPNPNPNNYTPTVEAGIKHDIFDYLGLTKADNRDKIKGNEPLKAYASSYMEIRLQESRFLSELPGPPINLSLPYNHEKVISDRLTASIKNKWGSGSSPLSKFMGIKFQQGMSKIMPGAGSPGSVSAAIANAISSYAMFEYDAGSTKKTLSIPFIVPLAAASKTALENNAAQKIRKAFNDMEGLLYPRHSGFLLPPLMELTLGGLYRSFFGFVTAIDITPTNNEVFMDPCSGQYFSMVYDGTLTFDNLFLYYHGSGGSDVFDIDNPSIEVLFGAEAFFSDSGNAKKYTLGAASNGSPFVGNAGNVIFFGESKDSVRLLYQGEGAGRLTTGDPRLQDNKDPVSGNIKLVVPEEFKYHEECYRELIKLANDPSTGPERDKAISKLNDVIGSIHGKLLDIKKEKGKVHYSDLEKAINESTLFLNIEEAKAAFKGEKDLG